jgi:hypothetical protein
MLLLLLVWLLLFSCYSDFAAAATVLRAHALLPNGIVCLWVMLLLLMLLLLQLPLPLPRLYCRCTAMATADRAPRCTASD